MNKLRSFVFPLKIALKSREAPMVYGGTFAKYLEEWISSNGSLSSEANAALFEVSLQLMSLLIPRN